MHPFVFGVFCVWMGLVGAASAVICYTLAACGHEKFRQWGRISYVVMGQGIVWAAFHLMYLILHHRYDISYVNEYSSNELSPLYLVSSFWGGQQGTFFLWSLYGALLGTVFMARSPRRFEPVAMGVISAMQVFLMVFLLAASPFTVSQTSPTPVDGQGLNILLQNTWMVIHPPIMFLGFSAMIIPFAIAAAAILNRDWDGWVKAAWPWVLFAWCALGAGLFLGGYWAYTVLGWGGFWGWDNVENSSLIPWLAATALVHGMLLQHSRGIMQRANLFFAMAPFIMVLFGSFLTRSGILSDFSVHSFAAPDRLLYDLLLGVLIAFTSTAVLLLIRLRQAPHSQAVELDDFCSRGFFFVIASWVLFASSLLVLIGTSWPLISQLQFISARPANVSPSFYNQWLFPVGILLCAMMGAAPFLKWQGQPSATTSRTLARCLAAAAVLAVALTFANAFFYRQSLQAPADAIVRTNPSAYALTAGTQSGSTTITTSDGKSFKIPNAPRTSAEAYGGALLMKNGLAYPLFAFAAFFCLLAKRRCVCQVPMGRVLPVGMFAGVAVPQRFITGAVVQ